MRKFLILLVSALSLTMPIVAMAGPAEDADALVDRWASTFSANDPDELSKIYWPDAILLGTGSPIMFEGNEAILKFFSPLKGSGMKNVLGERRTIVLSDDAVAIAGFYETTLVQNGKPVLSPARFTMVIVQREWGMAHCPSPLIVAAEVTPRGREGMSASLA